MKIGVVGDFSTVMGFRLAGVREAHEVDGPTDAANALKELAKKEVGLIVITEKLADQVRQTIAALTEGKDLPLLVEIPDREGPVEGRADPIKALIKKAVGVDIKSE